MTISELSKKTLRQAIDTLVAKQGFVIKGNGDGTVRFIRAPLADMGIRYL
jgi:DNA-binding GntR family transcriptional regulator